MMTEKRITFLAMFPGDQPGRDNRSDQLNPNNPEFRGGTTKYTGTGDKADLGNHADQKNPNNPKYPAADGEKK